MRKYDLIIYTVLACTMTGCTITGRISRRQTAAEIRHSTRRQREYIEEKQQEHRPGYIEYTRADSTKVFLMPAITTPDGETMPVIHLQEVVAVAPSRSIPERNGKVALDFMVTLPKELMGNCRGVEITPVLHRPDREIPLQNLTIRGALFNKVQERNYWQYDRYLEVFDPDETGRLWAYERFIRYPYPEGTRLDSVVSSREGISYFYIRWCISGGSTTPSYRLQPVSRSRRETAHRFSAVFHVALTIPDGRF